MSEIQIAVINKRPSIIGDIKSIVADNSDYTVRFSFDDQWEHGAKTVLFVLDDGYAFPAVKMVGDIVPVPRIQNGGIGRTLYVGVVQGDVRTTSPAGIAVKQSIADMIDDEAVQPDPSMWEDVLSRLEKLEANGGGGSVPAGTDLVGHAMISLMGASYDSLEVTSITFPPDVTDDADQQRMLRSGAVKAVVSVAESEDELEAGVLDCIDTDGIRFTFAGITVGKNRTAFVIVDNFADTNEYQAEVLAVHEGGGSSGDAMRLKVLAELPYEGAPPIIDMIDFTREYTFADIAEAFVAGRTITLHTEHDVVPYQYGMFWLDRYTHVDSAGGLEFHGHYWRVKDVEADVDEGWVPAVAFLREDGTLTVEDREWSGYAKQTEVDKLSEAIDDTETIGKLSIYDSSGTLLGSYQGEESDIKLPESNNTSTNINPVEATDEMTQPVGVDKEGKLFTAPAVSGLSSGAENWRIIKTLNFSTETSEISFDTDDNGDTFKLSEIMLTGTVPAFSGYILIRDYSSLSSSHHGNNSVWPTASKNMTWWLASVNGKLKTLFGVSAKAVLEPVDANTGCPEKLTGLTIGASAGFTESGTMYVYGR